MIKHTMRNPEVFLTTNQAARLLSISLSTLKKIIYQGKIKTLKTPGGHHRVSKNELFAFIARNSTLDANHLNSQRDLFHQDAFLILEPVVNALEKRMFFHQGHTHKVIRIAVKIAEKARVDHSVITKIQLAALLHDIGLITIKEDIINKRAPLITEEYSAIRNHPSAGYDIVNSIKYFSEIANIVKQHHERFDGAGYPDGLKKDEICTEAKVLSVAEAFSAMTAENSYKSRLSVTEALEEVKRNAHKQFDPRIVESFLKINDYE